MKQDALQAMRLRGIFRLFFSKKEMGASFRLLTDMVHYSMNYDENEEDRYGNYTGCAF